MNSREQIIDLLRHNRHVKSMNSDKDWSDYLNSLNDDQLLAMKAVQDCVENVVGSKIDDFMNTDLPDIPINEYSIPIKNPEDIKNDQYLSKIVNGEGINPLPTEPPKRTTETVLAHGDAEKIKIITSEILKDNKKNTSSDRSVELTKKLTNNYRKMTSTEVINIRLNHFEKTQIEGKAEQLGFKNVSEYIRFVALNAEMKVEIRREGE